MNSSSSSSTSSSRNRIRDWFHSALKHIDHNRWTYILITVVLVGTFWMAGCQPQTSFSPLGQEEVTAQELEQAVVQQTSEFEQRKLQLQSDVSALNEQIRAFNQQVEIAEADLSKQQQMRADFLRLLGTGLSDLAAGTLNPAAFIIPGLSLLGAAFGVGKTIDNRRKDKVIRDLKETA
jgi:outer membrane murein-binding lipoprotein Lpp